MTPLRGESGGKSWSCPDLLLDLDNNYITVTHCRLAEPYIE